MCFPHWAAMLLTAVAGIAVAGCGDTDRPAADAGLGPPAPLAESSETSAAASRAETGHPGQPEEKVPAHEAGPPASSGASHAGQPLNVEGAGSFRTLFVAIEAAGLKATLAEACTIYSFCSNR